MCGITQLIFVKISLEVDSEVPALVDNHSTQSHSMLNKKSQCQVWGAILCAIFYEGAKKYP